MVETEILPKGTAPGLVRTGLHETPTVAEERTRTQGTRRSTDNSKDVDTEIGKVTFTLKEYHKQGSEGDGRKKTPESKYLKYGVLRQGVESLREK